VKVSGVWRFEEDKDPNSYGGSILSHKFVNNP